LAALYEEQQDIPQALKALERGLRIFPGDGGLLYHQGVIHERGKNRDQAIAAMRQVIEIDPEHAEALNFLAYIYAEEGIHLDEALDLAGRALELKPEGHIIDTLGWVYFKLRRYGEARVELERAALLMPDDSVVQEHLGDVYRALKLWDKARRAYLRALELNPDNASVSEKLEELSP